MTPSFSSNLASSVGVYRKVTGSIRILGLYHGAIVVRRSSVWSAECTFRLLFSKAFMYKDRVSEVTRILDSMAQDDPKAAEELLPLVYDELRHLAAQMLSHEKPGQTLQATALVHEAWLRVAGTHGQSWDSQTHFFGAAAEAMRRILIESARRKRALEHGGNMVQTTLDTTGIAAPVPDEQLLAVDEALEGLSREDPEAAQLVKLRFFVGLPHREAAQILGLSHTKADRAWLFAKAWLAQRMKKA